MRPGRSLAALAILATAALALAGCGGGSAVSATPPATTPTATPAAASSTPGATPATGASGQTVGDTSLQDPSTGGVPSVAAAPGSQVRTSSVTPKDFVAAIGVTPILVVFYQPLSPVDLEVLAQAKAAQKQVPGTELFAYQAGNYKTYQDIPSAVNAYSSPSVAVIDRAGDLQNVWNGYVDSGLIGAALKQAATAKPAKVAPSEVPAGGTGGTATASGTGVTPSTTPTAAPADGAGTAADPTAAGATATTGTTPTAAAPTPTATTPTAAPPAGATSS